MEEQICNVFISHIHEDDADVTALKELLAKNGCEFRDSSINSSNPNEASDPDYIKSQILAPQARDFGFAPNPFYGVCTLATCKPLIRRTALVGDWITGTGSARNNRRRHLVFAMRVNETLSFDEYWNDDRFQRKKPQLDGSKKLAYGDNIYHRSPTGQWIQANSHHSHVDGSPNLANIKTDTQTNRVLVGSEFMYWGGSGPLIPSQFRQPGSDIRAVRGHKSNFSAEFIQEFLGWLKSLPDRGYVDRPLDWKLGPKLLKK